MCIEPEHLGLWQNDMLASRGSIYVSKRPSFCKQLHAHTLRAVGLCTLLVLLYFSDFSETFSMLDDNDLSGDSAPVDNKLEILPPARGIESHSLTADRVIGDNFVFVFDFWERMINIQTALQRLVYIGVDAGFTVVEPYVYESRTAFETSLPQQFQDLGLEQQPASTYFDTAGLHHTKHFVSFKDFSLRSTTCRRGLPTFDSVLIFDWQNEKRRTENDNSIFYRCDERLHHYNFSRSKTTPRTWNIAGVSTASGLCVSPRHTTHPTSFTATYFAELFAIARKATIENRSLTEAKSPGCLSVAVLNYRKHSFNGYETSTSAQPFQQKILPLQIGHFPSEIAREFRRLRFNNRPYTALQIRTGKAWVLLGRRPNVFSAWLENCVSLVTASVRGLPRSDSSPDLVYIASDLYNLGWKGGEKCSGEICDLLGAVGKKLQLNLQAATFSPVDFNVSQDHMGISAAVDAAMCAESSHFLYTTPSNFGRWVHDIRAQKYMNSTTIVNCEQFM